MSGRRSEAYLSRNCARFMPAKDVANQRKSGECAQGNNTGLYGEGTFRQD
jgi:hypothetical protein